MSLRSGNDDVYEVEHSSEDIPLCEAKFVRAADLNVDRYTYTPPRSRPQRTPIRGIAQLCENRIVVVDQRTLYLVCSTGSAKASVYFKPTEGKTLDIAALSKTECIVLLERQLDDGTNLTYECCLQLFSIKNDKITTSVIKPLPEVCYRIAALDNCVIVSFRNMICSQQIKGVVTKDFNVPLQQRDTGQDKTRMVSAVSENGQRVVYFTDEPGWGSNLITKLSWDGNIIKAYTDWESEEPSDITATGDGCLFMSFCSKGCIKILVPDMSRLVTVLDKNDGIQTPIAICYDQEKRKLFVSDQYSRDILVFQIQ